MKKILSWLCIFNFIIFIAESVGSCEPLSTSEVGLGSSPSYSRRALREVRDSITTLIQGAQLICLSGPDPEKDIQFSVRYDPSPGQVWSSSPRRTFGTELSVTEFKPFGSNCFNMGFLFISDGEALITYVLHVGEKNCEVSNTKITPVNHIPFQMTITQGENQNEIEGTCRPN